jgi:hypothetical protein
LVLIEQYSAVAYTVVAALMLAIQLAELRLRLLFDLLVFADSCTDLS